MKDEWTCPELFVRSAVAGAFEIDFNEVKGVDLWGGRAAHPAVVNMLLG